MKTLDYLAQLRERDIQVWAEAGRLRCNAPAGLLTGELRRELEQRKDEILQFLHSAEALARQQRAIVPLQAHGAQPPIFGVAGHNGDVFCFRVLAQHLGGQQPFFGLQPPGLDGHSQPLARVEALAECFAAQIRVFRPGAPCVIAGYCAGGTIAFELARRLLRDGAPVRLLALFGSPFPTWYRRLPQLRYRLGQQIERVLRHTRALVSLSREDRRSYIATKLRERQAQRATERPAPTDPVLAQRAKVERATFAALRRYHPGRFEGRLALFLPSQTWPFASDALARWRPVAPRLEAHFGPEGCDGAVMLREPHAPVFAGLLARCMAGDGAPPAARHSASAATNAATAAPGSPTRTSRDRRIGCVAKEL